jgi:hypothetical protein
VSESYCRNKLQQVNVAVDKTFRRKQKTPKKIIRNIVPAFTSEPMQVNDAITDVSTADSNILEALVTKYLQTADHNEKQQILTVAVASKLSEITLATLFRTTIYSIQSAKAQLRKNGVMSIPRPHIGRPISESTQNLVKEFYLRDNVSCKLLTGTRDVIDGEPKRVLLLTISELYKLFKEEYKDENDIKIGRSKFASLRPKYCVFPGTPGTLKVCVCLLHENPDLMFQGAQISKLTKDDQQPLKCLNDCISIMVCSMDNHNCRLKSLGTNCSNCPGADPLLERLQDIFQRNNIENVIYKQWQMVDRCSLETVTSDIYDFMQSFVIKLEKLCAHSFIAKQQSDFCRQTKENLKEGEILVIMDFSENFSFVVQSAPQGIHWSNSSATIHVSVAYFRIGGIIQHLSHAVVSDCHEHNSTAVHLCQRLLLSRLNLVSGLVLHKIIYMSDGSAAQYKNRYNFLNLTYHQQDFNVPAEHHFFATSHGRGVCDAVGGTIKRTAVRASLQRIGGDHITTPRALFEFGKAKMSTVAFDYYDKADYKAEYRKLNSRIKKAKQIKGTQKLHAVLPVDVGTVRTKTYSYSNTYVEHVLQ